MQERGSKEPREEVGSSERSDRHLTTSHGPFTYTHARSVSLFAQTRALVRFL